MNASKLMTLALCAATCISTAAYAEDDPIVSATPVEQVADPVNPKPGMKFNGYNFQYMKTIDMPSTLDKAPAVKTYVESGEKFTHTPNMNQGVWEGFLKCKVACNCTIVIYQRPANGSGYVLFVNGKKVTSGCGERAIAVNVNAGYNHFKLYALRADRFPPTITIKPTASSGEPRALTPKDFFYDDKPELKAEDLF